ncbi:hypothetical protein CDAR_51131 [Caerostris darwini]|uniref:Uncharacterized protein n=1 Tax=Caerostris darwini TaxID=1538125 RepID=A0AAV4U6D1_9ARAC|nr:hypothetical protein CDAR_51131 [Caerostris darwini]
MNNMTLKEGLGWGKNKNKKGKVKKSSYLAHGGQRERLDESLAKTPDSTELQLGSIHKKARERDLIIFLRVPHTNIDSFGDSATIRLSESFAFYSGRYAKGNDFVSSTSLPSPSPRAPLENFIA